MKMYPGCSNKTIRAERLYIFLSHRICFRVINIDLVPICLTYLEVRGQFFNCIKHLFACVCLYFLDTFAQRIYSYPAASWTSLTIYGSFDLSYFELEIFIVLSKYLIIILWELIQLTISNSRKALNVKLGFLKVAGDKLIWLHSTQLFIYPKELIQYFYSFILKLYTYLK